MLPHRVSQLLLTESDCTWPYSKAHLALGIRPLEAQILPHLKTLVSMLRESLSALACLGQNDTANHCKIQTSQGSSPATGSVHAVLLQDYSMGGYHNHD